MCELDHIESWAPKNWCFWTVVLDKAPETWATGRSNQSILKEISPEHSLEGLMLKLKLQYFGHLMQRANSLGKTLMLGKIEGKRRRGQQNMRWSDSITNSTDMNFSKLQDSEAWCCSPWGLKESDTTQETEQPPQRKMNDKMKISEESQTIN